MIYQKPIKRCASVNAHDFKVCTALQLILATGFYAFAPVMPAHSQSAVETHDVPSVEDEKETTELDPVIVTATDEPAGYQGAPEWVYEAPYAVSVMGREEIKNASVRSAADLFEQMPGVSIANNPQDTGISINVRGLQDMNRINVTVDGARQNFQKAGHGETGRFYIDPAFIRQVEVEKSATSDAGGAGALGGTVKFETIRPSDILEADKNYGVEGQLTTGTNEYHFEGNVAAAGRISENIEFLAGVSHRTLGTYDIGQNGVLEYTNEAGAFTGSDVWSGLGKLELDLTDNQHLTLSMLGFHDVMTSSTHLGTYQNHRSIVNLSGAAKYTWQPDNDLIDFEMNVTAGTTQTDEYRTARTSYGAFSNTYKIDTIGLDLQNTSYFDFSGNELQWNYGFEGFRDFGETTSIDEGETDDEHGMWFGADPSGIRTVYSGFTSLNYNHNDFLELGAGLRYDWFNVEGSSIYHQASVEIGEYRYKAIYVDEEVSNSGGRVSPNFSLAITPVEGLQLFGKYSEGYRIPTIMETLFGGEHIGVNNPYLRYTPNPDLEGEIAYTWEGGVNLRFDDLLQDNDKLRVKLSYFHREIENYTALAGIASPDVHPLYDPYGMQYVNLLDPTFMEGFELEANYDAEWFYAGLGFARTFTEFPDQPRYENKYQVDGNFNESVSFVMVAPTMKITADAGVRLFEKKLTLGGRMTHVVPHEDLGTMGAHGGYIPKDYTVFDLYGSYALTDTTKLQVNVDNLTDVAYVDALTQSGFPAPGRTITATLNFKF